MCKRFWGCTLRKSSVRELGKHLHRRTVELWCHCNRDSANKGRGSGSGMAQTVVPRLSKGPDICTPGTSHWTRLSPVITWGRQCLLGKEQRQFLNRCLPVSNEPPVPSSWDLDGIWQHPMHCITLSKQLNEVNIINPML